MSQLFHYGKEQVGRALVESGWGWLPTVGWALLAAGLIGQPRELVWAGSGVVACAALGSWLVARRRFHAWGLAATTQLHGAYLASLARRAEGRTPDAGTTLQRDLTAIDKVAGFYNVLVPAVLGVGASWVLLMGLSLWQHSLVATLPIGCLVVVALVLRLLTSRVSRRDRACLHRFVALGQLFLETLGGLTTLVSYEAGTLFGQRFASQSERFRRATMRVLQTQLASLIAINGLVYLTLLLAPLALRGPLGGRAAAFVTLATLMLNGRQLGYFSHGIKSQRPALREVFGLLEAAPRVTADLPAHPQQLVMRDCAAAFDDQSLFKNVSLTLAPGGLTVLCGANGSGKTTLLNLINGSREPARGAILLDGQDLAQFSAQKRASVIGTLGPAPQLFSGTIASNLKLACPDDARRRAFLARWQLLAFIRDLPAGWNTVIGENGRLLSPGQRQELALAMLLLTDKPVYLLDEITTSVDRRTTKHLLDVVGALSRSHLILWVSHDPLVQAHASKVYQLAGQLALKGGR
ncbi:ATP-binding cassette domain-containing protein [Lacticaseibacillus mingshuiensis]|uniref:ATP-binding cassette domain-containing protein n=1 Tax=Lacticaseibacillus mingshuiensis TaxID=2799574 RepID=A0ABW4CK76_9LACO|nr:ATP-binding cassette domain-containing protein [Lacticaseibacillus mingshuiensis]